MSLMLLASCEVDNRKSSEADLDKVLLELKGLGKFENFNYEFVDKANRNLLKVTFSNTSLKNFDEDAFGKNSAKKIYNLNSQTKRIKTIWISIHNENLNDETNNSQQNVSSQEARNLLYESIDFEK